MASAYETRQQREAINKVYTSAAHVKKVNLMDPGQVFAFYMRLKNANLIKN